MTAVRLTVPTTGSNQTSKVHAACRAKAHALDRVAVQEVGHHHRACVASAQIHHDPKGRLTWTAAMPRYTLTQRRVSRRSNMRTGRVVAVNLKAA